MMNMINALFNVMKMRGINIPNTVNKNDPNAVLNYLMQNGNISQEQYENARQESLRRQQQFQNMNMFRNNQNR